MKDFAIEWISTLKFLAYIPLMMMFIIVSCIHSPLRWALNRVSNF